MKEKIKNSKPKNISALDIGIIKELYNDSRQSNKQIAKKLKSNQSKINRRISWLLKQGYIKRFTIKPDFWKLGKSVFAVIYVKLSVEALNRNNLVFEDIALKLKKHPNVFHSLVISGEWDILLIVRTNSMDELHSFTNEVIRKEKYVMNTLTSFSFKEIEEYDNPFG
ncbi:MAG: Lrp/AsnC family transcriptional regulator [Pseudomonadota bacterium]